MKERIRTIMERESMTQKEFSEATGIKQSSLSSILNGHSQATNRHVEAIYRRFPEYSLAWIMFGKGEMLEQTSTAGEASQTNANAGGITGGRVRQGAATPSLFDAGQGNTEAAPLSEGMMANQTAAREIVKIIDKPQRRIREIQVIFDDNTIQTFIPRPDK